MTRIIVVLLMWALSGFAADVTIKAEVDRSEVTEGGRFTYSVTITGSTDFDKVKLPQFLEFDVISGPSSSTQIELINGKMSRSGTYSYVLRAKKTGNITIKPAVYRASRKKSIRSNSVTIGVIAAQQSPRSKKNQSKNDGSNRKTRSMPEVFIEAKVDKDSVYKFDMITVTYDLYFKVNVSNYSFPRIPNATGFWQEEFKLPARPVIRDEVVRGVAYKVATIRKVGLFPTRTGTLRITPLTSEITVEVPRRTRSRRRSLFDDSFFGRTQSEIRSVTSENIELTVLDMPRKGKPVNFKGDVGAFQLSVNYDQRELSQHDALNIEVTINGTGYVKSVSAPKLSLPAGFEVFEPTIEERISMSGRQMRGKKIFKYLVIPRRTGTFKLKPVRFSYFDPIKGTYRSLKKGGRTIIVTPSVGDEFLTGGGMTPEEVHLLGSDIRYIKELSSPLTTKRSKAYTSPWFFTLMAISPVMFLLGLGAENIVQKHFSDPAAVRLRRAITSMKSTLNDGEKQIDNNDVNAAITTLSQNLSELVGAIIHEPGAGLIRHTVESGLRDAKMDSEQIDNVTSLIEEADKIRFSGVIIDNSQAKNLLKQFANSTAVLEKLT